MTSTLHSIGLTVDIATIQVDEKRLSFAIFNKHATAILYLKEGREVSATNGIPVYPNGNLSLNFVEDGQSVRESWSMISDTAATPVVIFEGSK